MAEAEIVKKTTVIKNCSCPSAMQDGMHGKGNRVMNWCRAKENGSWRCTVCGKLRK